MQTATQDKPCQDHEIESVLETCHPHYQAVLADRILLEAVKSLVDNSRPTCSRELVIFEAIRRVVQEHTHLEVPSVWFG